MKLYQPKPKSIPVPNTTEDNVSVTLMVTESENYCRYPHESPQYDVEEVVAKTKVGDTGDFNPNPDGDETEEAIIYFRHDGGRTLSFDPAPQDVTHDSAKKEYRVEFPVPASPAYDEVWAGEIDVQDNGQSKKKIKLTVTVRKAGPGT